jgi:uncharacterized protein
VQTTQLSVRFEYEWNPGTNQQRLIGYFAARQLTVDLRELDKLGSLMERAVPTGVNIVSGPRFGSTREAALRRAAIKRAAVDARANAQSLAQLLGEGWNAASGYRWKPGFEPSVLPYAMAKMEMAADASEAAETYQTARINISAQVTAEFDLLVD